MMDRMPTYEAFMDTLRARAAKVERRLQRYSEEDLIVAWECGYGAALDDGED